MDSAVPLDRSAMQSSGNIDSTAQNHQDTMFSGCAFIHSKKIQINEGIQRDTSLTRLKLPHIKDYKKWAYIDEVITEALNLRLPTWRILKDITNRSSPYCMRN